MPTIDVILDKRERNSMMMYFFEEDSDPDDDDDEAGEFDKQTLMKIEKARKAGRISTF